MDKINVSRRGLLKWSAFTASSITGFTACSKNESETGYDLQHQIFDEPDKPLRGGKWIGAFCWYGCGGGCVNQAYVKDGIVIRQKTDDSHVDTVENPQHRGCLKGRSTGRLMQSADRLKYPMKRKSWSPGGGSNTNGHLRGQDEWIRISWDEALDLVASEITRIKDTYGNRSILNLASELDVQALNAYGGATSQWGQMSLGAWPLVTNMMRGNWRHPSYSAADRLTLLGNTKLLVLWGQNPAWTKPGLPSHTYRLLHEKGVKIICVDPWHNPSCQSYADEWIPVRPSTDTALLLAIAHELIINNWHDQNFLDTYTIGFDSAHMPAGSDPDDNFQDYIMGTFDGIPKSAEWASEICGTPIESIKSLAKQMGTVKPMAMKSSLAPARTENGSSMAQAFYTVGCMTGNMGIAGAEVTCEGQAGDYPFHGPSLIEAGWDEVDWLPNPACESPRGGYQLAKGTFDPTKYYGIGYGELWKAVLSGKHWHFRDGEVPVNIKAMVGIGLNGGSRINQVSNVNLAIEAFKKVEFVVTSDFFLTPDGEHSDIVLPISSSWEQEGDSWGIGNREMIAFNPANIIPPRFESKHDDWVDIELMKRWGVDYSHLDVTPKQRMFNAMASTLVIKPGGGYENLLSITDDDIANKGVTGTSQNGRIPYSEFIKKGWYQVERTFDDEHCFVPFKSFREDPIANPLNTDSGKVEIYCSKLVEKNNNYGLSVVNPISKYETLKNGYESTFSDWTNKIKGEYPMQFITVHPLHRVHTNYDNMPSLREISVDSVWINTLDAQKLNLAHGDWALLTSKVGKVARRVTVTPTLMPGVLITIEGSRTRFDKSGKIDISGNPNSLTEGRLCGEGQLPYNTNTCKIEKYTGEVPEEPDFMWQSPVPKFFAE